MTHPTRLCFVLLLLLLGASGVSARAQTVDPAWRAAVVRVEASVDPTSGGPDLLRELSSPRVLTPFEGELLRRLRMGAVGTGFFITKSGYLVTNAHVVLSGVRYRKLRFTDDQWDTMAALLTTFRSLWVTVGEGKGARDYLATPVVVSEDFDLAILKVQLPPRQTGDFAFLPLAKSSAVKVGDAVSTLGFPHYEFQFSKGRVLALVYGHKVHEEMQLVQSVDPVTGEKVTTVSGQAGGPLMRFQHNAPTGHGSSGGPLLDPQGRVIGVAYALLSETSAEGSTSMRTDLNLGIVSDVLARLLRQNGLPFTEAAP